MTEAKTEKQRSSPLGATVSAEGTNFSLYSKHATGIELLLFDCVDDARPKRVISIDPTTNRTSDVTCLETDVIGRSNN